MSSQDFGTNSSPSIRTESNPNSKKNSSPEEFIYLPAHSKITHTLERILKYIEEKYRNTSIKQNSETHAMYHLTLDQLDEIIRKDTNLTEQEKSKASVDDSLKQMTDTFTGGKNKYGYIYPFLLLDKGIVVCKIALIAPGQDQATLIKPFRNHIFDYSIPVIDSILKSKSKPSKKVKTEEDYQNVLIKVSKFGEPIFYPSAISLEHELALIIKKGFAPFNYLPMKDFIDDFINYGMITGRLMEITPSYHIVIDDLLIDKDGKYLSEPELIRQFKTQWKSLEKIIINNLSPIAQNAGFNLALGDIENYMNTYETINEFDIAKEKARAAEIAAIAGNFPLDDGFQEAEKKLIKACHESSILIKNILSLFPALEEKRERIYVNECARQLMEKISNHSREKLTLFIHNMQAYLAEAKFSNQEILNDLEKEILKRISNEMGFYESTSPENKIIYYLVDPGYMAAVVHNLSKLAYNNVSYKKQLDIAKSIYNSLMDSDHKALDINIKETDRMKIIAETKEIERKEEIRKKKLEFESKYNLKVGFISFLFSLLYFIGLYGYFHFLLLLIAAFPVSLVTGIIFAKIFRRKKNKNVIKDISERELTPTEEKINTISKASETILYKKDFHSIEERIHDKKSLREAIILNFESLKKNLDILSNEKNTEKAISTIESAILSSSALINIPKELQSQARPQVVIISKEDLKSPEIRSQIAEHFYYKGIAAKKFDSKSNAYAYYSFLYNTIDRDYFKYIRGK